MLETVRERGHATMHPQYSAQEYNRLIDSVGVPIMSGQTVFASVNVIYLKQAVSPKKVLESIVPELKKAAAAMGQALAARSDEGLLAHPVVGGSWEGFVVENLLSVVPRGTGAYFYRDSSGAELDLVLTMPSGEIWAVEVKRTTSPKVSRGFHTASNVVAADARFLVYAGDKEVPMLGDIRALPLPAMMDHLTQ